MTRELTPGRLLRRSLRRHPGTLAWAVVSLTVWQLCEIAVPVLIGVTVDLALIPRDPLALVLCLLGLAALFTVLSYAYRFGARAGVRASAHEAHALRMEVARVPLAAGARRYRAGEVLSLSSADADLAAEVLRQVGRGGASLVGLLAAAVFLLFTDPFVGLVVVVGVPASIALVSLPGRRLSRRTAAQQEAIAHSGRLASDLMSGLRVLKAVGGERWGRATFRSASDDAAAAGVVSADRLGRVDALGALMASLVLGGVLLAAGWRAVDGQLGVGALIAIVGVAVYFEEPLRTLAETAGLAARSHGAATRIAEFLTNARPAPTAAREPHGGDLRLAGLDLGEGRVLDLTVPEGQFLAVAADHPVTARLVAEALSGEHPGRLSLGGVPLDGTFSAQLLAPPHESELFEGTIGSNITLRPGRATVSEAVLRASGTDEMLSHFPDGLAHALLEGGRNLSGGQRQRIALARALHAAPATLVLHDPTSAVDALTEWQIAGRLREIREGRTTVVVTSAPGLLAHADIVVHIPAAGPPASGPHHELLATSSDYRAAVAR